MESAVHKEIVLERSKMSYRKYDGKNNFELK